MSQRKGKAINFELNLVPFIDLLSTLICFLLLTSVWQELDAMSTNAPPPAPTSQSENVPNAPNAVKIPLSVTIDSEKIEMKEGENALQLPNIDGEPDVNRMKSILEIWKERYPSRNDVVLKTSNQAKYKYLVLMMDTLLLENFSDVGIDLN